MISPIFTNNPSAAPALGTGLALAAAPPPSFGERVSQVGADLIHQWQGLPLEGRLLTGAAGGGVIGYCAYKVAGSLWSLGRRFFGPVSLAELEQRANLQRPSRPQRPPIDPAQLEPTIISRLQQARAKGYAVDIFFNADDPTERADHYQGVVRDVLADKVHLVNATGMGMVLPIAEMLTVRRCNEDWTTRTVMGFNDETINEEILKDKAFYELPWSSRRILMDYADPRLRSFVRKNFARLNIAVYKHNTVTLEQAAEEVFAHILDHFQSPGHDGADTRNQQRVGRIGDVIACGPMQEAALVLQVIFQYLGIESRLEQGPPMLVTTLWVRAKLGGREMIFDPAAGYFIVKGQDEFSDRLMELYIDDESDAPADRPSTDGGMGFTDGVLYMLGMEQSGIRIVDVRDALIEASWVDKKAIVFRKDLMRWRLSQMERYIKHYIQHGIKQGSLLERIDKMHLAEEACLAVIAYSLLSTADRDRLWSKWRRRPNGGLPDTFCQHWLEQRALGRVPFYSLREWSIPPLANGLKSVAQFIEDPVIEWDEIEGGEAEAISFFATMVEIEEEGRRAMSLVPQTQIPETQMPATELAPTTQIVPPEQLMPLTQAAPQTEVVPDQQQVPAPELTPWTQVVPQQQSLSVVPGTVKVRETQPLFSGAFHPVDEGVDPQVYDRPTIEAGIAPLSHAALTVQQGTPVQVQRGQTVTPSAPEPATQAPAPAPGVRRRRFTNFSQPPVRRRRFTNFK